MGTRAPCTFIVIYHRSCVIMGEFLLSNIERFRFSPREPNFHGLKYCGWFCFDHYITDPVSQRISTPHDTLAVLICATHYLIYSYPVYRSQAYFILFRISNRQNSMQTSRICGRSPDNAHKPKIWSVWLSQSGAKMNEIRRSRPKLISSKGGQDTSACQISDHSFYAFIVKCTEIPFVPFH